MSLKLYIDWLSQPSRALVIGFKTLGVDFEIVETRIAQGQHKTPEFLKINPRGKVPAITDGDFGLGESHSIFRYVVRSRNIDHPLYPLKDVKQCARIDEYLDYHHTNTRKCATWFFTEMFLKDQPSVVNVEQAKKEALSVLKFLDQKILSNQKFLVGDTLTFADLSAFCEIVQLLFIYSELGTFKNLSRWMNEVYASPHVADAHQVVFKMIKKRNPDPKF